MIHRLTIICFIVILVEVLSQGGGSGGGSSGGGIPFVGCIFNFNRRSIISCMARELIILLIVGLICCIVACCTVCSARKNPRKESAKKVEQTENELTIPININNIFESGKWSSRYYQYKTWHGPAYQEITFNIEQSTLNGNGIDNVGEFTLTGNISSELLTINMIKKYMLNTGDAKENLGHEVKIDLIWNNKKHAFEGQWSTHTSVYKGEDQYELIKVQPQQPLEIKEQDSPV